MSFAQNILTAFGLILALPVSFVLADIGDPLVKLTASDAGAFDEFGNAVSLSGNTALVGSHKDNNLAGSAYLFDAMTGQQLRKLSASDGASGDNFGASVALSGNTALIGADIDRNAGEPTGSVYVFDASTGQQLRKLLSPNPSTLGFFGQSVDLEGTTAVIGSPGGFGSTYLFDVTTGQQLRELPGPDVAGFGESVAISGNLVLVGAPRDSGLPNFQSGAAYLFDATTGLQVFRLVADDASSFDNFGTSVALSGNLAIIGAPSDSDAGIGSGSAYVFDVTTGQQLYKITAADAGMQHGFGLSVSLSGNTAIVGAFADDFGVRSGAAYLFDVTTGQQLYKYFATNPWTFDRF
jgi:hypothetical protein